MILVVGATGDLGSEVCQRLRDAGMPVRGLVRATADETKLERLRQMGVELAYGDLKNRDSLVAAVQDVDTVMTTATTTISRQPDDSIEATDRDGCLDLVAAAKAAGVGQFIYTSYSRNIQSGTDPCALTHAKRSLESAMQSSGMTYTILRPSYYMEVWLSPIVGFDYLNASATIYGAGKTPVSWISRSDVAAFAVASLENAHARNATLELGGPEALSPLEVVSIFESVGGRPFEVNHVPVEALQEQKQGAQDSVQEAFAALMLTHEAGDAIDMEETAEKFAIDLTSVREYAESVMETEAGGAA